MASAEEQQREAARAMRAYAAAGYVPGHDGVLIPPHQDGGMILLGDGRYAYWRQGALPVAYAGRWCLTRHLDWREAVGVPGSPLRWKEGREDDPARES